MSQPGEDKSVKRTTSTNLSSIPRPLSASNLPPDPDVKGAGCGIRHLQCVMLFLSMVLCYSMRVNMSMAIVAMTDSSKKGAFNWSMQTQSVVLSSFFWGYVILQIPGGPLADKFGGSLLITICVGVNSVITLLLPLGTTGGFWQVVCALRILQGFFQGYLFPCLHNLIGKWVPVEEKGRLGTLIYSGGQLGTALQLTTAGFISDKLGWKAIFYINGVIGVIWTIVYVVVGAPNPQKSKLIRKDERMYIQTSLGQVGGHKTYSTPWKSMFTCPAFISLIVVHGGQDWGFCTLSTLIPSYMNKVLGVNISQNGVMSAMPYLTMFVLSFPFGFISDYVVGRKIVRTTTARKVSNSIGHFGPGLFLIGFAYFQTDNIYAVVTFLCFIVGLNAGHHTGLMLVHLDMSPNFAGSMLGVTNFAANVSAVVAPLVAGALLRSETDVGDWKKVFYLTSSVYFLGNTIFLIFGTSQKQAWNEPATAENDSNA